MAEETVQTLVERCRLGARGMSRNNPNRRLLGDCVAALTQLTDRLSRAETALSKAEEASGPGPDISK